MSVSDDVCTSLAVGPVLSSLFLAGAGRLFCPFCKTPPPPPLRSFHVEVETNLEEEQEFVRS